MFEINPIEHIDTSGTCSPAYTLSPDVNDHKRGGWDVEGEVHEDWYEWVNEFSAEHKVYGRVWGDFESTVYADSEEGYYHFKKHNEPNFWDYWDI